MKTKFFVKNNKKQILSVDFEWVSVKTIRENPELIHHVLCTTLSGKVAQNVCEWFKRENCKEIYPFLDKTLKSKYDIPVPKNMADSLAIGIQQGKYPSYITRRPNSQNEIEEFHKEIQKMEKGKENQQITTAQTTINPKSGEKQRFFVKSKSKEILSVDLEWVSVKLIRKNPDLIRNMLCTTLSANITLNVCKWLRMNKCKDISCFLGKTLTDKYGIAIPDDMPDSLAIGIQQGKYPSCITGKAQIKSEMKELQKITKQQAKQQPVNVQATSVTTAPPNSPTFKSANNPAQSANVLCESELNPPNQQTGEPTNNPTDSPAQSVKDTSSSFLLKQTATSEAGSVCQTRGNTFTCRNLATPDPAKSSNFLEKISDVFVVLEDLLVNLPDYKKQKTQELNDVQSRLLDLRHLAEFCALNASDGYRVYKTMHELLKERRRLKDELLIIANLMDSLDSKLTPENVSCLIRLINRLSTRKYDMRMMTSDDVAEIIKNKNTLLMLLKG